MCFGYGNCPSELPSGNCGHQGHGPKYCNYEDDEDYKQAKEDYEDEKGEYLYEQQKERKYNQTS